MPIEVILKKPVSSLGAEADVVKVKAGYARNYLFPYDIAAPVTSASKRQIEELKKRRAEREAQELNDAEALSTKLAKLTLTFQMQLAGESKVFGSITAHDILTRLGEMGYPLDKKKLVLPHPIKTLGEHWVAANLGHEIQTKFKVVLETSTSDEETLPSKFKGKRPKEHKEHKEHKDHKEIKDHKKGKPSHPKKKDADDSKE